MKLYHVGRRVVGRREGNIFRKEVRESKHLMRTLDAWGIDSQVFNDLPEETVIYIFDQENNLLYSCTKDDYKNHGEYRHFKEGTKDHYTQIFLGRKHFNQEVVSH